MWRTAGAGRGALWAGAPAGQYLNTISAADIATGWWEGEAITGRSQKATEEGLCQEDAKASCCTRDEGRSLGVALQGEASNCHGLLRPKAAVVNAVVKRREVNHVMYGLERRMQMNL